MDNPFVIVAVVALGVTLNLGFFFTLAMTPDAAVTMFGTFPRAQKPAGYWFWRGYHAVSFVFNILLAIAVIFGLFFS